MAYGQTGTGKTFTLGQLGEGDTSSRGIMVRSMEDILSDLSPDTDSITVSYHQVVYFYVHYCFLDHIYQLSSSSFFCLILFNHEIVPCSQHL